MEVEKHVADPVRPRTPVARIVAVGLPDGRLEFRYEEGTVVVSIEGEGAAINLAPGDRVIFTVPRA